MIAPEPAPPGGGLTAPDPVVGCPAFNPWTSQARFGHAAGHTFMAFWLAGSPLN